MLAILYLALSIIMGFCICQCLFPKMYQFTESSFSGEPIESLSPLFLLLPLWLYTGLLPLSWAVYILALILSGGEGNPLSAANAISMAGAAILCAALLYRIRAGHGEASQKQKRQGKASGLRPGMPGILGMVKMLKWQEIAAGACVSALIACLMYRTLYVKDGRLSMGLSTFSDFSPHLSMIRSFSSGTNFPTEYTPFAGSDVKYHFLFQFLCGNLEFLGLRIDHAFNLPTILGFLATISLLYVFALKLSGSRMAGLLGVLIFLFRSSPSLLSFLAEKEPGELKDALLRTDYFIGYTPHEDWGLWNLNVYLNQRHLAFTLGVLVFVVMLFTQIMADGHRRLRALDTGAGFFKCFFRESLFSRKGWAFRAPECLDPRRGGTSPAKTYSGKATPMDAGRHPALFAIFAGLLLGMIGFWNGAVVIAALLILFVLAIYSDGRLSYLLCAAICLLLVYAQSRAFIKENAFALSFYFGFIAEHRTVFGVLDFIWLLTGLMCLLVPICFAVSDGMRRCLLLASAAPFFFAFTVSLTVDPTVNHKYIMISLMLLGLPVAEKITELFRCARKTAVKALAAVLVLLLLSTGIFETRIILNRNNDKTIKGSGLTFDMEDETTQWILANKKHGDIFLTAPYAMNNVILAGTPLFLQHPYYAWSAGYDTYTRDDLLKAMYGAEDAETLKRLVAENRISYIIVDDDNRRTTEYALQEEVIASAFPLVYHSAERNLRIYRCA